MLSSQTPQNLTGHSGWPMRLVDGVSSLTWLPWWIQYFFWQPWFVRHTIYNDMNWLLLLHSGIRIWVSAFIGQSAKRLSKGFLIWVTEWSIIWFDSHVCGTTNRRGLVCKGCPGTGHKCTPGGWKTDMTQQGIGHVMLPFLAKAVHLCGQNDITPEALESYFL